MSTKKKSTSLEAPRSPQDASAPEPAFPPLDMADPGRSAAVEAWIAWQAGEVERASQLSDERAKRVLSRAFAEQVARHRILTQREAAGKLPADVARTVPAVSRQIRDLARELGITERKKKASAGGVW